MRKGLQNHVCSQLLRHPKTNRGQMFKESPQLRTWGPMESPAHILQAKSSWRVSYLSIRVSPLNISLIWPIMANRSSDSSINCFSRSASTQSKHHACHVKRLVKMFLVRILNSLFGTVCWFPRDSLVQDVLLAFQLEHNYQVNVPVQIICPIELNLFKDRPQ